MSKPIITDEQKKNAEKNLAECQNSLAQQASQLAVEQMKKAKEELDKAQQMLSELPEKAIGDLMKAVDMLMSVINGHIDTNSPEFDIKKIIAQIEALLKPVLVSLGSLPIPEIPGLSLISKLLAAIKSLIAMPFNGSNGASSASLSEIPPQLMAMLNNLLNSLLSLCSTLPLVLINLVFQMLNVIIGLFKQIAGILGVPSIPFPLNLVPNCIAMMPDLMNFMLQMPGKMFDAAYGTLKSTYGKIMSLQIPEIPDGIKIPDSLASSPQREK